MTQSLDRFKFRYYDTVLKFMGDVISLNTEDDYLVVRFSYADENTPDDEVFNFSKRGILMQCTGLKDKNGKLIYERDIVKYVNFNTRDKETIIREVRFCYDPDSSGSLIITPFNDPCIGNYSEEGRTNITSHCTPSSAMEIIGNIYENPELLNN